MADLKQASLPQWGAQTRVRPGQLAHQAGKRLSRRYLNNFQNTAPTLRWRPDLVHGIPVARATRRFAFVMPSWRFQLHPPRFIAASVRSGCVGARGIKRRKPYHRLPRLRGHVVPTEAEASPLTPMGVVGAYGKIARAAKSRDPRLRRAGIILGPAIALPVIVFFLLVGLATR